MKTTARISTKLIDEAAELLRNAGELKSNTANVPERALYYLLYGTISLKEENYTKGRVHTWAKRVKLMAPEKQEEEERLPAKIQDVLKEVIEETSKNEQEYTCPRSELFCQDSEEIEPACYTSDIPPWQAPKKVEWREVEELYNNPHDNPFLIWAKRKDGTWSEIKTNAIKVALAHMPPPDRTTAEAWKLVYELERRFREWYNTKKGE